MFLPLSCYQPIHPSHRPTDELYLALEIPPMAFQKPTKSPEPYYSPYSSMPGLGAIPKPQLILGTIKRSSVYFMCIWEALWLSISIASAAAAINIYLSLTPFLRSLSASYPDCLPSDFLPPLVFSLHSPAHARTFSLLTPLSWHFFDLLERFCAFIHDNLSEHEYLPYR